SGRACLGGGKLRHGLDFVPDLRRLYSELPSLVPFRGCGATLRLPQVRDHRDVARSRASIRPGAVSLRLGPRDQVALYPLRARIEHEPLDSDDENDEADDNGEHQWSVQALAGDVEKVTQADLCPEELRYQCDFPGNPIGHAHSREDKWKKER